MSTTSTATADLRTGQYVLQLELLTDVLALRVVHCICIAPILVAAYGLVWLSLVATPLPSDAGAYRCYNRSTWRARRLKKRRLGYTLLSFLPLMRQREYYDVDRLLLLVTTCCRRATAGLVGQKMPAVRSVRRRTAVLHGRVYCRMACLNCTAQGALRR